MSTCCIYTRFSSTKQKDGFSTEAQIHACTEYAKNNDLEITHTYIDEAQSGGEDNRENFQRMLSEAQAIEKPFDLILVYAYDRFSRNRFDHIKYKQELSFLEIHVVSITQPIDPTNPDSVLLESIYEGMSESYSRKLARDVVRGHITGAKNGLWQGGHPPLGYKLEKINFKDSPKSRLIEDKETSWIIKEIFDLYLTNKHGFSSITKLLNQKTEALGIKFIPEKISRILRCKKYIGTMSWVERRNRRKKLYKPGTELIEVEDCHPKIISKKRFEKAQDLLKKRSRHTIRKDSKHLLTGLLTCGYCGQSMVGIPAKGSKYLYYTCLKKRTTGQCKSKAVNSTTIEPKVIKAVKNQLSTDKNLSRVATHLKRDIRNNNKELTSGLEKIQKEKNKLEKKYEKLLIFIEDNEDINISDISDRLATIKIKIKNLTDEERIVLEKQKVSDLMNRNIEDDSLNETLMKWIDYKALKSIEENVSNGTLKKFIRTITLTENSGTIEFYLSEDWSSPGSKVRETTTLVARPGRFTNSVTPNNQFLKIYNTLKIKSKIAL